jgi:hypothetical protein
MTKKSGSDRNARSYKGRLIELRRVEGGWATSFRKFAHVEFTDLGVAFPSQREAIQHARRFIDWEIEQQLIANRFESVFDELLQERYPLALIFDGLAQAVHGRGWEEQTLAIEEAVRLSPGQIR